MTLTEWFKVWAAKGKPRYRYYPQHGAWLLTYSPWRVTGRHYVYKLYVRE